MFFKFLYPLKDIFSGFNIFRYITFRSAGAVFTAMTVVFLFGPGFIRFLNNIQLGERIREDGPHSHQSKSGTPTIGGILIIFSILITVFFWGNISNNFVLILMLTIVLFGSLGFVDDYIKAFRNNKKGIAVLPKFLLQIIFAFVIAYILYYQNIKQLRMLYVPFLTRPIIDMGWLFIPFAIFIIVAASNTVNLSDGLDGLAIGSAIAAFLPLIVFAYVEGHIKIASYLLVPYIGQAAEVTVFIASIIGASIGFLWFNSHPAEIFMGDTGSLALGSVLGVLAIMVKKELLLPVIGGIFVIEGLSVILQVGSFKFRKKRIFKMAPIHHHFELKGWSESKVVIRFWIIGLVFALAALITLKIR